MKGRYRNDIADDPAASPANGPANGGFSGRPVPAGHGFTGRNSGPGEGGDADEETPDWFIPQQPGRRPVSGGGGFTGASEPGGPSPSGFYGGGSGGSGGYGGSGGGSGGGGSGGGGSGGGGSGGGGHGGFSGPGGSGGYEYGGRRRKRRVAVIIGSVAGTVGLALLLGAGAYVLAGKSGGCSGKETINLTVAASPDIAAAVTKTAGQFNEAEHEVGGRCVKAAVRSAESAGMTTRLSGQSGATNVGNPDMWIPDSSQWTALVRTSEKGKDAVRLTKTSVAQSPIVIAMPQPLAEKLRSGGAPAQPSWETLLNAATGSSASRNPAMPKVQLYAPEPSRNGTGLVSLLITSTLLANKPDSEALFTGIVRTVRESTLPTVDATLATFAKGRADRPPIALAPEQAVWRSNRRGPTVRSVALYPREGTMSLDYPVVLTTTGDTDRLQALRLLETALASEDAKVNVRELGFRSADGKASAGFGPPTGVNPQPPTSLPAPSDRQVATVMQAWLKLSLSIRMLSLFDISGSMNEKVAPGITRMQATVRVAQGGVSLFPNDTELGTWAFSTKLQGNQDWRQIVPLGPLGERIGSITRRQLVLSSLGGLRAKPNGDTGLYESILAALKYMTKTYKPEFANSIMLLTDGKNDDPGGPSLKETLAELRRIRNPGRPVQVMMIGYGKGVDTKELQQIADATDGSVHVALSPADVQKIFLRAVSRRTGG